MRIFAVVLLILAMAFPVFAADGIDIQLTTPIEVQKPAVTVGFSNFKWTRKSFVIDFDFSDADGKVVDTKTCTIQDYTELVMAGFCANPDHGTQAACEGAGAVWTPPIIVEHTDFTGFDTTLVRQEVVGLPVKSVIAAAMFEFCKPQLGL